MRSTNLWKIFNLPLIHLYWVHNGVEWKWPIASFGPIFFGENQLHCCSFRHSAFGNQSSAASCPTCWIRHRSLWNFVLIPITDLGESRQEGISRFRISKRVDDGMVFSVSISMSAPDHSFFGNGSLFLFIHYRKNNPCDYSKSPTLQLESPGHCPIIETQRVISPFLLFFNL